MPKTWRVFLFVLFLSSFFSSCQCSTEIHVSTVSCSTKNTEGPQDTLYLQHVMPFCKTKVILLLLKIVRKNAVPRLAPVHVAGTCLSVLLTWILAVPLFLVFPSFLSIRCWSKTTCCLCTRGRKWKKGMRFSTAGCSGVWKAAKGSIHTPRDWRGWC